MSMAVRMLGAAVLDTRVTLIGGFSLTCGGVEQNLAASVQRLVAFVALQKRPVPRQRVAFTLWPESDEAHAYGSLRTTLFRLRSGCRAEVVRNGGSDLALAADVGVDLRHALALSGPPGSGAWEGDADELEAVLRRGQLLPDWYDDWVLVERERFHEFRLQALETLCDSHLRAGDAMQALVPALAAVHADPLRESSRRTLIRVHLAAGNRAEAFAQYRHFAELLARLDLTPSWQLDELVHDSQSGNVSEAVRVRAH